MKKSKYFAAAILLVLLVGVIGVIAVNKNKAAVPSQPPVSTEQAGGKTRKLLKQAFNCRQGRRRRP